MKKILVSIALLSMLLILGSCFETNTITLKNDTGIDIYFAYASPSSAEEFEMEDENDFLGQFGVFEAGKTYSLAYSFFKEEGNYDFRFIDDNDDYYDIYEVDVKNTKELKITPANKTN